MSTAEYEGALDDFLDDVETPEGYYEGDQLVTVEDAGPTVHERPWRIPDDGAADWALRKLARAKARHEEVRQLMIARQEKLREWEQEVLRPIRSDEAHWTALLDEYALRRREETGTPSVKLPNGTLGTTLRDKGGSVEIHDPTALDVFLMANPALQKEWCKITAEPQVGRFKTAVRIEKGARCSLCGKLLRFGPLLDRGSFWLSAGNVPMCMPSNTLGADVPKGHSPIASEDGEIEEHQVPVVDHEKLGTTIVPGLAVRAEHVISRVTPG